MPNKETDEALEHLLKKKKLNLNLKDKKNQEKEEKKSNEDEDAEVSESSRSVVNIPAPTLKRQEIESKSLEDMTKEAKSERQSATKEENNKTEAKENIQYGPTLYNQEEKRVDTIGRMDDMRRLGTFANKGMLEPMQRQRVEMPDMPGSQMQGDIEKYVTENLNPDDVWRQDDLIKKPETLKKYRKR